MNGRHRHNTRPLLRLLLTIGLWCPVSRADTVFNDLVVRGFEALDGNRNEKALHCFLEALEANPDSAQVESCVGLGYFKTEAYDQALEHYERAVLRDPTVVDSAFLFYRASCYRGMGLVRLELKEWQRLTQWDPDSRFARVAREAIADRTGEEGPTPDELLAAGLDILVAAPNAAAACFREALLRSGRNRHGEALLYLGSALNRADRHKEALSLQGRTGMDPGLAGAWHMQHALALTGLERWEEALEVLESIGNDDTVAQQADYVETVCRIQLGQHDEALASLPSLESRFERDMVAALRRLAVLTAGE